MVPTGNNSGRRIPYAVKEERFFFSFLSDHFSPDLILVELAPLVDSKRIVFSYIVFCCLLMKVSLFKECYVAFGLLSSGSDVDHQQANMAVFRFQFREVSI